MKQRSRSENIKDFARGILNLSPKHLRIALEGGIHPDTEIDGDPAIIKLCKLDPETSSGVLTCLELLLKFGADPNIKRPTITPLMFVMDHSCSTEMARMLLRNGAEITAKQKTAVELDEIKCLIAINTLDDTDISEMLDLLLDYGVNLNKQPKMDEPHVMTTPWPIEAIENGKTSFIRKYIDNGGDLGKKYGTMDLLQTAARRHRREIFEMLLDAGAVCKPEIGYSSSPRYDEYFTSWKNSKISLEAAKKIQTKGAEVARNRKPRL